tara:strand:- start:2749 stop:3786 length:1038 start_codon:yes stop_codon:yes gene_type:complete
MKKIDKDNMYESIWNFPENIIEAIGLSESIILMNEYSDINKIVVAGMGGSAIGGDVVQSLVGDEIKIPYFVVRGYNIPAWVDSTTLVICSSYSGNTEETIEIFEKAKSVGAKICAITTGGRLEKLCDSYNLDRIIIPSGLQPRAALSFSFIPILFVLLKLDIISSKFLEWLESSTELIKKNRKIYSKKNDDNPAWVLAKKIFNKIPIIYADSDFLNTIAVRIKGQICENGKILAYHNIFPEMNHNEIVGWEKNSELFKSYFIIWIFDKKMNERNIVRQQIVMDMLNKIGVDQFKLEVTGNNFEERFLLLIHCGDWLSYWCAILNKIDPSPVKNINILKNKLSYVK